MNIAVTSPEHRERNLGMTENAFRLPPVVAAYIDASAEFHGERIAARRAANRPWDADGR